MKQNRNITLRWILAPLYMVIGVILIVCGQLELIDSFWAGMGGGLVAVGTLQIIRLVRYNTNTQYKEQTDTSYTDERNRFLRAKAWSWAGYLFVMIAAVATIVCKLLGNETLMFAASGSVCLIVSLYWICYLIVSKKY